MRLVLYAADHSVEREFHSLDEAWHYLSPDSPDLSMSDLSDMAHHGCHISFADGTNLKLEH